MEKWFCWSAMGVGGLVLLLFLLDVIIDKPFGLRNVSGGLAVDILAILCCSALFYLGWNAYRDIR